VASEYNTEFYYTLLDDIYIEANRSERDELLDRQKVVDSLLA
jgi:hypothetical protein